MPDVGRCQRRRVIHAVAHHRDLAAAGLEPFDGVGLVGRQHLRRHLVDPEPPGHRIRDGLRIAGDHGHLEAHRVEPRDRLRRLRPDLVLDRQGADHHAVRDDMEDGPAFSRPGLGGGVGLEAEISEQSRTADGHLPTVDGCLCSAPGQRLEVGRRCRLDAA